ncbi:MAG: hypothetical protein U0168_02035 [Nannocystaceae bacterium]
MPVRSSSASPVASKPAWYAAIVSRMIPARSERFSGDSGTLPSSADQVLPAVA